MNALSMLRDWRRQVQDELLPDLHGHQSNALADLSFAMALAQHCQAGKLAVAAPGDANPASVERRVERFLANDRLDPDSVWPQLARSFLAGWAGGPIVLILDETPNHNDLRCMKVTLAYRKRALPLCSRLLRPRRPARADARADRRPAPPGGRLPARGGRGHAPGRPRPGLAAGRRRLRRAGLALRDAAARARPGSGPPTAGSARRRSWPRSRGPAGAARPRSSRSRGGGPPRWPPAGCRTATGRGCWSATATTARGCSGRYAKRTWTEELFRDEKSSGFHWGESHVTDPAHAARLVLLIALATYLALARGVAGDQGGAAAVPGVDPPADAEPTSRSGCRWVMFCLTHDRSLPENLSPVPQ